MVFFKKGASKDIIGVQCVAGKSTKKMKIAKMIGSNDGITIISNFGNIHGLINKSINQSNIKLHVFIYLCFGL